MDRMKKIELYIIYGFLESGKTEFIQYTLSQEYFNIPEKTLLIQCEEGMIEISKELLEKSNTVIEIVETEETCNQETLVYLQKKHGAKRIILEYNGVWDHKNLVIPNNWELSQAITTIDATTFQGYYKNMASFMKNNISKAEMIIVNRCQEDINIVEYKKKIQLINPQAEIIFEDENGEIETSELGELPYDIDAEIIELDNIGYGIWNLDALDHIEKYIDKKVEFIGMVLKPETFPKDYFVPGRTVMDCCVDDMAFVGFVCQWDKANELREKEWVRVTAIIQNEYWPDYQGEGPVLYAIDVEKVDEPKEPIISLI